MGDARGRLSNPNWWIAIGLLAVAAVMIGVLIAHLPRSGRRLLVTPIIGGLVIGAITVGMEYLNGVRLSAVAAAVAAVLMMTAYAFSGSSRLAEHEPQAVDNPLAQLMLDQMPDDLREEVGDDLAPKPHPPPLVRWVRWRAGSLGEWPDWAVVAVLAVEILHAAAAAAIAFAKMSHPELIVRPNDRLPGRAGPGPDSVDSGDDPRPRH